MSSSSAYDILLEDTIEWIVEHLGPAALVAALFIICLIGANSISYVVQLFSYKETQCAKTISIIITLVVLVGGFIILLLALGMSSSTIFGVGVGAITSFFVLPFSTFLYDIFAGVTLYSTNRVQVGEEIIFKGFIGEVHGTVKSINTTHTTILQKNNIIIDIPNSNIYSGWISHIPHGVIHTPSSLSNTSNNITFVKNPSFFSL
jgi:small-conductance mechanosensitive channel